VFRREFNWLQIRFHCRAIWDLKSGSWDSSPTDLTNASYATAQAWRTMSTEMKKTVRLLVCMSVLLEWRTSSRISRRSENHELHVFHPVARFSGAWSWTALVAVLASTNGLAISSSSFSPFPERYNCFLHSFNDTRGCDFVSWLFQC
jgi:hypothetical protein